MKQFRKLAALLLILTLAFSLTGCYNISREVTQEEKEAIEAGTVTDGVYENALFAIGFAAEDGWTMTPAEEILELNEWKAADDMKDQVIASMGKPGYFYEMIAQRDDGLVSVNVRVENMAVLDQPDSSEEMYAAAAAANAKVHFEEIGSVNMVYQAVCQPFAGSDHYGYYVTCNTTTGEPLFYKVIYVKQGIYTAAITASSAGEDLTDEALAMFYEA